MASYFSYRIYITPYVKLATSFKLGKNIKHKKTMMNLTDVCIERNSQGIKKRTMFLCRGFFNMVYLHKIYSIQRSTKQPNQTKEPTET